MDHYGNTALHFAAARGHMNCVTFLINYGVNLFAKDIDYHTAKDLAAMNDRQDILTFLDEQVAKQERSAPKKVKALKEKADKDADRLVKDFAAVQEKARKLAEKEKKRLEKERHKMEQSGGGGAVAAQPEAVIIPRPSMSAASLRKDSRLIYTQSPKFSDLVSQKEEKDKIKLPVSGVYKKVQQQRMKLKQQTSVPAGGATAQHHQNNNDTNAAAAPGDFKVGAIEDGKRSVRSISGLRRDSEVMYVPKYGGGEDGLDSGQSLRGRMMVTTGADSGYGGDDDHLSSAYVQPRSSIFERPGFGGLAFRYYPKVTWPGHIFIFISSPRNSIAALGATDVETPGKSVVGPSVDDATSLNHNHRIGRWDNDDMDSGENFFLGKTLPDGLKRNFLEADDDDDEDEDKTPMHFFLCAVGLDEFVDVFVRDKFDLDSLMLISEADLVDMKIPRGHRLKLMRAIADRKAALENPPGEDELEDSHL